MTECQPPTNTADETQDSGLALDRIAQVASSEMAPVQTNIRMPEELREAVTQEAHRQGISFSDFVRQSLYIRLAWGAAYRAAAQGLSEKDAMDADTIIRRLTDAIAQTEE